MTKVWDCPKCGCQYVERVIDVAATQPQNIYAVISLKNYLRNHHKRFFNFLKSTRARLFTKPTFGDSIMVYTFENLLVDSNKFLEDIPNEFDVVVGLPRTGLTVASIIAAQYGRPLSTPENLVRGEVWKSRTVGNLNLNEKIKILLVDEIVASGTNLSKAKNKISSVYPHATIRTAAILKHFSSKFPVDYFFRVLDHRQQCEWELVKEEWKNVRN